MPTAVDSEVVKTLAALLRPYADRLDVVRDGPAEYYVQTKSRPYKNKPLMFGSVRAGKAYVSFHFFPLYLHPALGDALSPALRKRKQGMTCFNFRAVPETEVLAELRALTEAGFRHFEGQQLL